MGSYLHTFPAKNGNQIVNSYYFLTETNSNPIASPPCTVKSAITESLYQRNPTTHTNCSFISNWVQFPGQDTVLRPNKEK